MKTDKEKIYQTGFRVPQKQYDRIHSIADRSGVSINGVILMAVDIGLNQIEKSYNEKVKLSLDFSKERG